MADDTSMTFLANKFEDANLFYPRDHYDQLLDSTQESKFGPSRNQILQNTGMSNFERQLLRHDEWRVNRVFSIATALT